MKKGFRFTLNEEAYKALRNTNIIDVKSFRQVAGLSGDIVPVDTSQQVIRVIHGTNEKRITLVQSFSRAFWIPGNVPSWKNSHMIKYKKSTEAQLAKRLAKAKARDGRFNPQYLRANIPYIGKSELAVKYERESKQYYNEMAQDFRMLIAGKEFPIWVEMFFVRKRKANNWDFMNLAQGVADMMVRSLWLPDDSIDMLRIVPPLHGDGWATDDYSPGVRIRVVNLDVTTVE